MMRHTFLDMCTPTFDKYHFGKPLPSPKLAKTHLPYDMVAKMVEQGTKVVVGLRNPKDTLVSYFHFYQMVIAFNFKGTFGQFFELFRTKHLLYGDPIEFSLGWWNQRHRDNVYICFYEDFNENAFEEVEKIAKFLGQDLTKEQTEAIVQWASFKNMKQEKTTNYSNFEPFDFKVSPYMRKGTVGDWKNYLSETQSKYIDDICQEKCASVGLEFKF